MTLMENVCGETDESGFSLGAREQSLDSGCGPIKRRLAGPFFKQEEMIKYKPVYAPGRPQDKFSSNSFL